MHIGAQFPLSDLAPDAALNAEKYTANARC